MKISQFPGYRPLFLPITNNINLKRTSEMSWSKIEYFKTFSTQIINLCDYKRFIYRNKVVINENKYELRV